MLSMFEATVERKGKHMPIAIDFGTRNILLFPDKSEGIESTLNE
jgi:hypothetical protein